jgi:hypothetical protein
MDIMDTTDSTSYKFFFTELSKIINSADNANTTTTNGATSKNNIIISSTLTPTTPVISINDATDDATDDADNYCLITKERLHPNHVTLSCNHKFNYIPIYKEIVYQKNKANTTFEITKLSYNEIKCPYCRRITRKLLPYIPYPSVKQIKYVNSPDELCMSTMKCQHIRKCKNLGDDDVGNVDVESSDEKCDKNALYYEVKNVLFCVQHFRQYEKRMKSIEDKKTKEYAKIQEKKAEQSLHPHCKTILKSGKNIGKPCDRIIYIQGAFTCKIHS